VSSKHPDIKSPADFKGKTLGVTCLGSSTNFLTLFMASKAVLKPGDFVTVPVGAGGTFIAAMMVILSAACAALVAKDAAARSAEK
ncbi:ABC transporter substrate-binding protein, partial [Rhizobium leguminosarum]|uniref:ABC transporter substrate-binding protein n=1 Tax=Rhizobium leguminosarum TaxID=384 RepID=UPI003F94CA7E